MKFHIPTLLLGLGVLMAALLLTGATEAAEPEEIPAQEVLSAEPVNLPEVKPAAEAPLEGIVPLEPETLNEIYGVCRCDKKLFCAVMSIACIESGFDVEAVGDGGNSIGMFQINTLYQSDRMEALGVRDLTDPVQCAAVAVDYIDWLERELDLEEPYSSHLIYMAYNMGLQGSLDAQAEGITETRYSREAVAHYTEFLEIVNERM